MRKEENKRRLSGYEVGGNPGEGEGVGAKVKAYFRTEEQRASLC